MAVFTKTLRKHIFVHPADQCKLQSAIKITLLKDRKTYSDSLEGALLDVDQIQVVGDRHLIVNGYLSLEVMANFKVFAPTIGMTLQAVVNKVHKLYYGGLVMDLFNATMFIPTDSTLSAKEGDTCNFVVNSIRVDGKILFVKGTMISVSPVESPCGIKSELESCSSEMTDNIEVHSRTPNIKTEPDDIFMYENTKSPKKKKHKKSQEERMETSMEDSIKESPSKRKKKAKSRDSKSENTDLHSNMNLGSDCPEMETKPVLNKLNKAVKVKSELMSNVIVKTEPLSPDKKGK